jgi:AraC-like DNA-binding protein
MMSDQYAVLPHGSATLVFTCSQNSIGSSLFGPITKPVQVGYMANTFRLLFIVEFQPAGYYAFSGIPQNELADFVLSFNDVNPTLHRLITQKLEEALSIESFIREMDRLFLSNLKIAAYQQEFSLANHLIIGSGGSLSVKELSQEVFYSQRHLSRIFDKYIGVNTKYFSSLVRVNKALRLLRRPGSSILQVCMQAGFYDTSHFIHDCKAICGITPQEYRNNMSDFYSEIAKF